MKLSYCMDIGEKSVSLSHTPVESASRLPFFLQNCGHYYAQSGYYTERDGLDNYLLIYTLSGCGYLKYKNAEYLLKPNRAVIFHCLEYQCYKTASKTPWEFKYAHLNGPAAGEFYDRINGDCLSVIAMGENARINGMLDDALRMAAGNDQLPDSKLCACLMNILAEMISCRLSPLNNKKYEQHREDIDHVVGLIASDYEKRLNINEIVSHVHMSKYYFIRLFKAYTGLSPYEYLMHYRINASKVLLGDLGLTVGEISSRVGFGDVNNFIRYFKRLTGTTPLNYRKYWIQ